MTLAEIKVGQDAVLRTIGGQGELRHHLLDMGLTPGTEVTLRKVAPMGDPIEVELRGYELTLRLADAAIQRLGAQVNPKIVLSVFAAKFRAL